MKEETYRGVVQSLLSQVGNLEWGTAQDGIKKGDRTGLSVDLKVGNRTYKLYLEFRPSGEPRSIAEFIGRLLTRPRGDPYPVLVAPFISERGRELCKRSGIGCIDLSGNAYLKFYSVYIDKWGGGNKFKVKRKRQSLLSPKSTWVIRSMLEAPKKEWTMQELSQCSSVSLAQVHKVLEGLESENYVEKRRGAITLSDPSGLLDLLVEDYRYDDQEIIGYYSPLKGYDQVFSRLKELLEPEYALTLGAAAQLTHPVVRSTDVYMYVRDVEVIKEALELEPVEFGGNIYLITPKDDRVMRSARIIDGVRVVSDLQLYLDLYNYPQRGREQAEAIREKVLRV